MAEKTGVELKRPHCGGNFAVGTACGKCWRCQDNIEKIKFAIGIGRTPLNEIMMDDVVDGFFVLLKAIPKNLLKLMEGCIVIELESREKSL